MSKADRPTPKPRRQTSSSSPPTTSYTPVKELPGDLTCPVCQDIINQPMMLDCCGMYICKICVDKIVKSPLATGNHCPYCQKTFNYLHNPAIQRRVNALQMYCPNHLLGCQWIGRFAQIEDHVDKADLRPDNNCQYHLVPCSIEGCAVNIPRCSRLQHEREECDYRQFVCPYCQKYSSTYTVTCREHFPTCLKFPTACPNECGIDPLPRDAIERHMSTECPLQNEVCEYSPVGCYASKKRCDMSRHTKENASYHNSLLLKEFVALKATMEEKTSGLQQECNKLRETNKKLSAEICLLTAQSSTVNEEVQDKLENIKRKYATNKETLDQHDTALASLSETVTGLVQNQKAAAVEVDSSIEASLHTLTANVQQIREDIPNIRQEVGVQHQQTTSLQDTAESIRQDIQYIEQWISPTPPFAFTLGRYGAHKKNKTAFSSPSFYTRVRGYKMCIRVDAESAGGTHVGVYCCVMRGEHDNHLKWPFRGVVHIRLQNHLGNHNHFNQVIRFDETTSENRSARVKTGDKNYLHGYSKYISHGELLLDQRQTRQYLKGDALDFEVTKVEEFN